MSLPTIRLHGLTVSRVSPILPADDAPIFGTMVSALQEARTRAEQRANELDRLLAEAEALHEPDANNDCPTCLIEAPCETFRLLHRQLSFDRACVAIRDREPIDLIAAEDPGHPPIPSLAELMAVENPALDRAFETLLGLPTSGRKRHSA